MAGSEAAVWGLLSGESVKQGRPELLQGPAQGHRVGEEKHYINLNARGRGWPRTLIFCLSFHMGDNKRGFGHFLPSVFPFI